MNEKIINFASKLFKQYYSNSFIKIDDIEQKEFGFGDFNNKISFRHFSFKNINEFNSYAISKAPAYISFSSAYYKNPSARPMKNKVWLGSDLIFDLDANDLDLSCIKIHGNSWVCKNCFDNIKNETIKLIEDFLIPDFGFSKNELKINFSGNRGYHVHVLNKAVAELDSDARKQISNYIKADNIDLEIFFPTLNKRGPLIGPKPDEFGWGGKLAKTMISLLNKNIEELINLGIEKQIAKKLIKNKAEVIFGITTGNWDKISIPKKSEFWKEILKKIAIKQSNSIDKNVTNDIHHLIRVPDTLHGETGLIAKTISLNDFDKFDPMNDAIAFDNGQKIKIHVQNSPKFYMKNIEFGPFDNEDIEIPLYAGLYLLLKNVGNLRD
ncbi:MAG: DNA primase catalytic subunit PriS [Candidatus Micrarchaeaceae archaeon]